MTVDKAKSPFCRFIEAVSDTKIYSDELPPGNNGDRLIVMGAQEIFQRAGCKLVASPEKAEQIVMRGGGHIVDIYQSDFARLAYYRTNYPDIPLTVGPSTYRFEPANFRKVCELSSSPLLFFARDNISADLLRRAGLPGHCDVRVSQDAAFELEGSEFIGKVFNDATEQHVLIAMRKDKEGVAGVLAKTRGTWLPKKIRRPLSWARDRIVAHVSQDMVRRILEQEGIQRGFQKIYRDIATSLNFEDFVASIRDASLVVTNRLHVGVLGHILKKRVVLICATEYHMHKIKGVHDLSMSGPDSKTTLHLADGISAAMGGKGA